MGWTNRWRKRLRVLTRRAEVERELEDELAYHLEMETEENLRAGMSREEARRQAAIAFGAAQKHREEVREARWLGWVGGISPDVKLGLRMLIRNPALSIIGGLGMAVAIAIGTGFFLFVNSYYFSTLPFDDGERIVAVENWNVAVNDESRRSLYDFQLWREQLKSVQDLAAFRRIPRSMNIPGGMTGMVDVAEMTGSGFRVPRVAPLLGRTILEEDEQEGAPPVIVVGYEEWQRAFAGNPEIVGNEILLGATVHTIIGVMPEGFRFPLNDGYWVPLVTNGSVQDPGEGPPIFIFGRLAPGVTKAGAQAELTAIGARMAADFPATHGRLRPTIRPYIHPLLDIQHIPLWSVWLMHLFASLLLTVVAVNVAVLVYARTATRRAEITVRTALGASRRRIITQLFVEALVLSAAAAAVGLLIARVGFRYVNREFESESTVPFWIATDLTGGSIAYAAALAALAAVIVGVLPALQATGRHLESTLRQMGGGTGMQMGSTWTVLIVLQVAIAVAVLPVAIGTAWSEFGPVASRPTFPMEEFLAFRVVGDQEPPVGVDVETYRRDYAEQLAVHRAELIRRVEEEPGVAAVTYALNTAGTEGRRRVEIEAHGATTAMTEYLVGSNRVDLSYFDVYGVPLLGGRQFEPGDLAAGASATIVNSAFVQQFLSDGEALGRRIRYVVVREPGSVDAEMGEPWYEIVGVVGDMYENPVEPEMTRPVIYRPLAPGSESASFAARIQGPTAGDLRPRLQAIATEVEPTLRVIFLPMGGPDLTEERRFAAMAVGLVTLSVLLLSAAGIYALMSFAVTRRQREVGIRSALGAQRGQLLRAIFSRAARQIALGLIIGAAAAGILDRLTGGDLLGGRGAVLLPMIAALMVVAGGFATLGPARRGLRVQPMDTLRQE